MQEIYDFAKKYAQTANDREVINLQKKHKEIKNLVIFDATEVSQTTSDLRKFLYFKTTQFVN